MHSQAIQDTLGLAKQFQESALEEMSRPEEDVVHYMVCKSAYDSALNYLKAYLLTKEIDTGDAPTLNGLIRQCQILEPKFKGLETKAIYDTTHPEQYWEDFDTSIEFIKLLKETIKIIDD